MSNFEHHFPLHELPVAGRLPLPRLEAAARECVDDRQVPFKLAYFTAAAACSAAAQAIVDVAKPAGGTVGTNVYALINAAPGERKTDVRRDFFGAFDEVGAKLKLEHELAISEYSQQMISWEREAKVLSLELKAAKGKECDVVLSRMDAHDKLKPAYPSEVAASMKEPSLPALKRALTNFPCQSIVSGDCAAYLRDVIVPNDTMFCDIWSGEKIDDPRITVTSYYCDNPRVTSLLMIQPEKLASILKSKSGKGAIASGYFGRMLYCDAGTSQGERFLALDGSQKPTGFTHRDEFNRNIKNLLWEGIDAMRLPNYRRKVLCFADDAARRWREYYNYVEEQIKPGGFYHKARDFAGKLPDNVARMAAAFHVTERFEGDEIGMECLMSAIAFWNESSKDYVATFVQESDEEIDANLLYDWLVEKLRAEPARNGVRIAKEHKLQYVSTISQYAPLRRMRGKNIHPLLAILARKGLISIHFDPVARGQTAEKIRLLNPPAQ